MLKKAQGGLDELNLSGCDALSSSTPFTIAVHLSGTVTSLGLDRCSWLADEGLMLLVSQCALLETVSLSGCTRLSPDGLVALSFCRALRHLDVSLNPGLTDDCLARLAMPLGSRLTSLSLAACEELSAHGSALLPSFSALTRFLLLPSFYPPSTLLLHSHQVRPSTLPLPSFSALTRFLLLASF